MENIEDILLKMEQEIADGKRQIFGSGVTINGDAMLALIQNLKESLPCVIAEAHTIIAEEQIRRQSQEREMTNYVLSAKNQAAEMVASHTITLNAQKEAEITMAKADEYARRMFASVQTDCDKVMTHVENTMHQALAVLANAKANAKKD